jgi:hypothetical protein
MTFGAPILSPQRLYEPNITLNPRTWMGIWTPQGWRMHRKRFGRAVLFTKLLSGDGKTTLFPEALLDPDTGRVEWQDDLHLSDDPFTDEGIYPADPRVEYPLNLPRWAVSHTLLCYPVADHTLWTHQYTWGTESGHLRTHFRQHIVAEAARTDSRDGMTVKVKRTPISMAIEGNQSYPMRNSAVRGVWANAQKVGPNFYTRRTVELRSMLNGVYCIVPHTPVVQVHGIWRALPGDAVDEVFDPATSECVDRDRLIEEFRIPLDEPKLGMLPPVFCEAHSNLYEGTVPVLGEAYATVDANHLGKLRERLGARFSEGQVGYAQDGAVCADRRGYGGYDPRYDLNDDGVIDEADEAALARGLGRTVRYNEYMSAYFGGDWISVGAGVLDLEHRPGVRIIADYSHGGGYDAERGVIKLHSTPGPDRPVWVEYIHDAPADAGENNIRIHLYREQ